MTVLFISTRAFSISNPSPLVLNEENERIMEVALKDGSVLSNGMISYAVGEEWFMPIGELAESLGLAIQVTTTFSKAHGFILEESRLFSLDLKPCLVKTNGKIEKFNCKKAQVRGDEIFVESHLLERWFPIRFQIDTYRSKIIITPTEKLPFQARKDRERDASLLKSQFSNYDPGYPHLVALHKWFEPPLFDQQLQFTRNFTPLGNTNTFQHTTEIGAELFGLESYGYITGNEKKIDQWQASFARHDPNGKLLGPLALTEIRMLYLGLPPIPLITQGKSGRGLLLSSYPLNAPDTFTNHTFQGPLTAGWEVELYRNDYLIDRVVSSSSGQYAFRNVALQYGRNQFRLTFYGPRGERRDEYQTYNIDASVIRPGRHDYRLGFAVLPNSTRRLSLQYEQSVLPSLSANAGYLRDDLPADGFGYFGLNGFLGGFLFRATGAASQVHGQAAEVGVATGLGPVTLSAKFDKMFGGFKSELLNPTDGPLVDTLSEATITHPLPIQPAIGMSWSALDKRFVDHTSETSIRNVLSTNIGPFFVNHEVAYTFHQTPSLLGKLNLNILRFISHIRLGVEYYTDRFKAVETELQQRIEDSFSVSLLLRKELVDNVTQAHLLATKLFKEASIGLDLASTGNKNYSAGILLSYSLNREPPLGGWQLNRGPEVQMGSASVFVFLDKNHNGKWDEGEAGIPNITVIVNQREADYVTGPEGSVYIGKLQPFTNVDLSVSNTSFQDPFLRPTKKGYRIVPRPGRIVQANFPVSVVGEIDGHVQMEDARGRRPKRGVKVELLSPNGKVLDTQTTDYDGVYVFEDVVPGKYILRIQNAQLQFWKQSATPAIRNAEVKAEGSFESDNDFIIR